MVFGEISSIDCLKQISSDQEYLISKKRFQLATLILSLKLSFMSVKDRDSSIVYSMSDDAVCFIESAAFLSAEK